MAQAADPYRSRRFHPDRTRCGRSQGHDDRGARRHRGFAHSGRLQPNITSITTCQRQFDHAGRRIDHAGRRIDHAGGGSTTPGGGSTTPGGGTSSSPPLQPPAVQAAEFDSVDITPGQTAATKDVPIHNPNTQAIEITGLQASAPFSIVADTCSNVSIQGQASCTITVQFAPTTLGASTGSLVVNSAAGQSTTQLSGTGFARLTIDIVPAGATVQDDSGFACRQAECTEQITGPVTLTAASKGFKDWGNQGACSGVIGPECKLNLTQDASVTAEF